MRAVAAHTCLVLALAVAPASADVPITVQTTECSGETGLASFDVARLYRIQAGNCADPKDAGRRLQQVLLHSDGDLTRYEVLLVTEQEATAIVDQVRAVSRARLDDLTGPDVVVEHREAAGAGQARAAPASPAPAPLAQPAAEPASARAVEPAAPPTIELLDPRLTTNRSVNRVITAPDAERRRVVGRVNAGAGILSLTVNGSDQATDAAGLFTADIATTDPRTPVTIVAVDRQGRSANLEFQLIRQAPEPQAEAGTPAERFGRYHALVIANNAYQHLDDLATPGNDATAIADLLTDRYGFETATLFDASRYEILSRLNALRSKLTENDNLLIYFAGHGAYDKANNRGHWLPVDAELDSTANWVSTIDITDIVNAMSARHVLVIADSCYSGALSRDIGTELDPGMSDDLRARWLDALAATRSRHVLTSGGLKPVPDDGGNGHSIFANALIEVLTESHGLIEGSAVFREVKQRVEARAQELQIEQTPYFAELKSTGNEFGEFVLVTR